MREQNSEYKLWRLAVAVSAAGDYFAAHDSLLYNASSLMQADLGHELGEARIGTDGIGHGLDA